MKIWLINPYGPVPSESWRDYCYTMMGQALAAAGHDVIWWTSNFSHHFKKFRSSGWEDVPAGDRFTVRLVPTTGYQKNVGLGRIWRDMVFAFRTYRRGKSLPAPDCIVFSESPLTFGFAGQRLAKFHGCPVIFHQMDLWPELIVNAFPLASRPLVNWMFGPVYRSRRHVYRQLSAASGLASPYLDVVLREAPQLRIRPHAVIYNGIDVRAFRAMMQMPIEWEVPLPVKQPSDVWAVFAGSLGPSYDIPTLIEAALRLEGSASPLHIVIAGDGPLRRAVEQRCADPTNTRLHYLGKLAPRQLAALYRVCDIGLCAYSSRSNVEMPDKIYDYTAAGLAVINSLNGEVREVIARNEIGLAYDAGNTDDLLRQLNVLGSDVALMKRLAANSAKIGLEYDKRTQYAKMTELIARLLSVTAQTSLDK
jgi:glycosyltransferase involved in cell wall biosynthesis